MPSIRSLKVFVSLNLLLTGCVSTTCQFEPNIKYIPTERHISKLSSPFKKLTKEELQQEWAREFYIGLHFGNELDLYRAITAFKRALILLPQNQAERKIQLEYYIFLSYYLGQKYQEALNFYQTSNLEMSITSDFPAFKDLLVSLYDCYIMTEQEDKANFILNLLEGYDAEAAVRLELSTAFEEGSLADIADFSDSSSLPDLPPETIQDFLNDYYDQTLSVKKAKTLNAILPGAGYYYVGQKKAAMTSFIINALFTWAAYAFIKNGYVAAGVVTASLETGWYIGGINGAGLEANEYNERLYEKSAKEFMVKQRLFPVLLLETSF